ncbi:MAG: 16S rRNA (cytidine(1402)-2'-O)-methyltransferase [Xanthomonadales bacterium]|nr:16S rRNA (cytidine(1402)-2'-O)-methyltransferase [Xanthomonadales bacterium]
MPEPALYVVATPIGNRQDITLRALEVLASVDCVAAEDTRRSGALLKHHGIDARLLSLHEHNETQRIPGLLDLIGQGGSVALISDAGTPLISDPGFRLINAVVEAGFAVHPVPGPSAVTAALSIATLATDRFCFEGFLPARQKARRERLATLRSTDMTIVLFETGQRLPDMLDDMVLTLGGARRAVICRELTKVYETVLRGTLDQLRERVAGDPDQRKGEFVILLEGAGDSQSEVDGQDLAQALLEYLPASQAARVAAKITGGSRREIYAQLGTAADGKER